MAWVQQLTDHKGRVAIVGKVDLRLDFGHKQPKIPVEIKDWSPNLTARLNTFDDVLDGQWTKKGAYQLLSYLYGSSEPFGFLLLPQPGLPKLIGVEFIPHIDHMEEFLRKAEAALDHKDAGTLPDFINDPAECKRCQFTGICNPPLSSGPGAKVFTDPEEEQRLVRMIELEGAGEEYEELQKWAKARFRGVEIGVAGSVMISGKWQRDTKYPLDDEAKKKVEDIKAPFKKVVEQGKWFASFTKL